MYITKKRNALNFVLLFISILNAVSFWSFRFGWHFERFGIRINLVYAMAVIFITFICAAVMAAKPAKRLGTVILTVFVILGVLTNILFFILRAGDLKVYFRFVLETLWIVVPVMVSMLFLVFPWQDLNNKYLLRTILLTLVFVSSCVLLYKVFPISFTTEPVVFDYGDDYAVVWTTNVNGVGWVELSDGNKAIYHTKEGKRVANTTLHKVIIPKEELSGSKYTVHTKRLLFHSANRVVFGRTIKSNEIAFEGNWNKPDISFLSMSDYHSMPGSAIKLARNTGNFDFLVLNGDMISFIADTTEIEVSVLDAAAKMTGGKKPVLISRGNHEMMSYGTEYLREYVATPEDRYYYTVKYGSLYCIVLDAGIDKPDEHYTYSGLVDCETYREEQTEWLKKLKDSGEYKAFKNVVVICHVPLSSVNSGTYGETMKQWNEILNGMNVDFAISGHTHKYKIVPKEAGRDFVSIEDGGNEDILSQKFIGTKATFSNDTIKIEFINQDGEVISTAAELF